MTPSREIPFFGEAPQRFWAIIAKIGFLGFLRMTRIANSVNPNNRITEYSVLRVTRITTRITEFGDSVLRVTRITGFIRILRGSSGKFTKEEPARDRLPFNDRRFTMMQQRQLLQLYRSQHPWYSCSYIDSVMITYSYEGASLWCIQQSIMCKIRLFDVNWAWINWLKIAPIPFMVHKYFLLANFLVLIISHINMMLIVMFEHTKRLHNGDYSQNKKLSKMLSLQDFAHHKIVKFHEITTYYLTTCVP
jgi:hypothetical protein